MNCSNRSGITCATCLLTLALVAPTPAAVTVVTGDGLASDGLFSSLSREAPRVLQQFYDASFFSNVAQPLKITSMSFRLPPIADVNYPLLGDLDFARYDITLAEPSAASLAANGLTSATFADNMLNPVLVRSGPLNIPAESFISNDANEDAEFSFLIEFDSPYNFAPGQDLVMLVRHSGHGDVHGVETRWNFDGYGWANGSVVSTVSDDAVVGNFGPGTFNLANKIQFTFVPEPTALLLLGVALISLGLCRFRQSRRGR